MEFYIVDVFARQKYQGNQLGVFVCPPDLPGATMQHVAAELGFSESTFITRLEPDGEADMRIFTPRAELDFAGHPVIGTGHVIARHLLEQPAGTMTFNLKVGPVHVRYDPDGQPPCWVQQPAPQLGDVRTAAELAAVLGLPGEALAGDLPVQIVSTGLPAVLVPVRDRGWLAKCRLDAGRYDSFVAETGVTNVFVFCDDPHEAGQDRASRMFAPALGVPEDPATGSANGCLAAYLLHHDPAAPESIAYVMGQGYEMGRPSQLWLEARRTKSGVEVHLGGHTVDVATGTWPERE